MMDIVVPGYNGSAGLGNLSWRGGHSQSSRGEGHVRHGGLAQEGSWVGSRGHVWANELVCVMGVESFVSSAWGFCE